MLWQQPSNMEPTHTIVDAHGSPYLTLGDYLSEHQPGKQNKLMQAVTTELDTSDLDTESERSDSDDEDAASSCVLDDAASQTITDFGTFSGPPPPPTLVTLPPEIRHEILKHLLILPADDASSPSTKSYQQQPGLLHTAILRANRLLYAEAQPLLYRNNTFLVHNTLLTDLPQLRRAYRPVLAEDAAAQIGRFHVCVRLDAEPGYDQDAVTRHLSDREEVVLEAVQSTFQASGPEVLRLFEGVRGVRRAKVVGGLAGFEDYARWLERAMMSEVGAEVEPFCWEEEKEEAAREPEVQSSWSSN
ncbi:hypothetical protein F4820DRAFT_299024 [Hypoxylon rubiginosum]|uniref:Uncharacterized protein n=1 Tax=Hypoxylon rubiginosum TaxID=110542 RepID=A0ACB9Z1C0_9PEZI|nr:hypothetical protein F4820DRAFT_299024 [Hypoxylon rubiginosum]